MGIDYYKAYVRYMDLTENYLFQKNSQCLKDVITNEYWYANDKIQESKKETGIQTKYIILSAAVAITFVLTFILFILYYLKAKPTESFVEESQNGH